MRHIMHKRVRWSTDEAGSSLAKVPQWSKHLCILAVANLAPRPIGHTK
jgi:hypothetical protein